MRRLTAVLTGLALVLGLPVGATARTANTTVRVPIATRAIGRGAVLTGDDIRFEERTIARGVAIDTTVAPGWVARRIINPGEILRPPAVQAPLAVAANAPLDLSYSDGGVALSLRGVAMRAASVGDRIRVRLPDGQQVDVIITAPGKARIL